ncbi:MAG: hypothetical protein AAF572_29160, partial [Cyanobacteria bacterium P01_B01_bin.77]
MDFITDLPVGGPQGFNGIFTCVDRLTKFVRLVLVVIGAGERSAENVACLFFANVVSLFGVQ